jgi:hypothetical protein
MWIILRIRIRNTGFKNKLRGCLQVHAYIISSLKKDMPAVFGKEAKKKELIKNLDALYASLQRVRAPDAILNSCEVLDF